MPKGVKGFQKGISGNPEGRPPVPEDLKESRKFNKDEFDRMMNKYLFVTDLELRQIANNPNSLAIERVCARFIQNSYDDSAFLRQLLERMLGKVEDVIVDKRSPHAMLIDLMNKIRLENDDSRPA